MSGRKLEGDALAALKVASRLLLADMGKLEVAAMACRLGSSQLADCASAHHPERALPIDVVLQLEQAAGTHPVTSALALLQGCLVVPIEARGTGDLGALLAKLGREVGDVFSASAAALADGRVTEAERATLARELAEMITAGQQALAALAGPAASAKGPEA